MRIKRIILVVFCLLSLVSMACEPDLFDDDQTATGTGDSGGGGLDEFSYGLLTVSVEDGYYYYYLGQNIRLEMVQNINSLGEPIDSYGYILTVGGTDYIFGFTHIQPNQQTSIAEVKWTFFTGVSALTFCSPSDVIAGLEEMLAESLRNRDFCGYNRQLLMLHFFQAFFNNDYSPSGASTYEYLDSVRNQTDYILAHKEKCEKSTNSSSL